MLLLLYYIVAITILVLHFTGWLRYHNLEWLGLVLAVTVAIDTMAHPRR